VVCGFEWGEMRAGEDSFFQGQGGQWGNGSSNRSSIFKLTPRPPLIKFFTTQPTPTVLQHTDYDLRCKCRPAHRDVSRVGIYNECVRVPLSQVWDPVLIIAQIVSIQCLFYLSLGFWQALFLGKVPGAGLNLPPGLTVACSQDTMCHD
jgi:hypothetical protein